MALEDGNKLLNDEESTQLEIVKQIEALLTQARNGNVRSYGAWGLHPNGEGFGMGVLPLGNQTIDLFMRSLETFLNVLLQQASRARVQLSETADEAHHGTLN